MELINAGLTRRDLARMGLLTAAGLLVPVRGLSARATDSAGQTTGSLGSPRTTPFTCEFRRLDVARECEESAMGAAPTALPNTVGGEGRTKTHQRFDEFNETLGHGKYYAVHEREGLQVFHSELPPQKIWGFGELQPDGTIRQPKFPGPVYHAYYGQPVCVRMFNDLPALNKHVGFGRPETTTHLHNGHTAPESDGNPVDYFKPGQWYDQHYANILAGHDAFPEDPISGLRGDVRETMGTLWYHDHRFDFTAQNSYRGLVGMYMLYGPQDSGNETDLHEGAFRLPGGEFEVPMVLADKVFDADGTMFFDMFNTDGILGDKFTVNGVIQPFMQVQPRKYRFRIVNAGPSRFYQLFLTQADSTRTVNPFLHIANDGNLLPAPVQVSSVTLAVAERGDLIIDFSKFAGKSVYLENRMEQDSGRGPSGRTLAAGRGDYLMRFDVAGGTVRDDSVVPAKFFDLPPIDLTAVVKTRTFRFERTKGEWAVNGKLFDPNRVDARPKRNTSEIWVIQNNSGGWQHPIHIHHEEFQILSRNGRVPPVFERGRKDVIRLKENEEVRIQMRFRDWSGRYPMHCHNTLHEDHSMMMLWEIED